MDKNFLLLAISDLENAGDVERIIKKVILCQLSLTDEIACFDPFVPTMVIFGAFLKIHGRSLLSPTAYQEYCGGCFNFRALRDFLTREGIDDLTILFGSLAGLRIEERRWVESAAENFFRAAQ